MNIKSIKIFILLSFFILFLNGCSSGKFTKSGNFKHNTPLIKKDMKALGKAEIAKLPLFGYFYKNNSVIVDRENIQDAYAAFLKAAEKLNKGLSMCIFPEGGIPKASVFLKNFKNGPFKLAIEQNIKIVPITLPDNKKMFPQEYFKGTPGIVRAKVHKAIDPITLNEKTIQNLNTSVYNIIFEQLKKYESR